MKLKSKWVNDVQQFVLEDFIYLNFSVILSNCMKYRAKILFNRYISSNSTVYLT